MSVLYKQAGDAPAVKVGKMLRYIVQAIEIQTAPAIGYAYSFYWLSVLDAIASLLQYCSHGSQPRLLQTLVRTQHVQVSVNRCHVVCCFLSSRQ